MIPIIGLIITFFIVIKFLSILNEDQSRFIKSLTIIGLFSALYGVYSLLDSSTILDDSEQMEASFNTPTITLSYEEELLSETSLEFKKRIEDLNLAIIEENQENAALAREYDKLQKKVNKTADEKEFLSDIEQQLIKNFDLTNDKLQEQIKKYGDLQTATDAMITSQKLQAEVQAIIERQTARNNERLRDQAKLTQIERDELRSYSRSVLIGILILLGCILLIDLHRKKEGPRDEHQALEGPESR